VRVFRGLPQRDQIEGERPVVTIGNFDGVHQGHQALLSHVVRKARAANAPAVALTFNPHPKAVIVGKSPALITTEAQKLELIERLGIDVVVVIPFTRELSQVEAPEFIETLLWQGTHLRELVVGYDFRFGKGGKGHYELLTEEGKKLGFAVEKEGATQIAGLVVSSTLVRQGLQEGKLEEVNRLLGRDYFIDGYVVPGHKRGRQFGYPTANLKSENEIIPARGVYATWITVGEEFYYGATNVGYNPTFGDEELSVETFVLDFDGDLYDKPLRLHFTERLRDEVKFDSVDALKTQIDADVAAVRTIFRREGTPLERRR
jgi:riboflavin kinase/FMN adenylyltransferase